MNMKVSSTIQAWAEGTGNFWYRILEVCDNQGFDLEDFLFDIWKENMYL